MSNLKYADWLKNYPKHMIIRKEGYYYTVRGDGAAVLGNIMGYRVSTQGNNFITGTTVIEPVLDELKARKINFILIEDNDVVAEYTDPQSTFCDLCRESFPQPESVQQAIKVKAEKQSFSCEEIPQMLETIDTILQGIDPSTGEYREGDSLYTDESFRAVLLFAQSELIKQKRRRASLPQKAGNAWSSSEDEQLGTELESGMTVKQIAEVHGRTKGAITSRIAKNIRNTHKAEK